jgi:hypothetical protein
MTAPAPCPDWAGILALNTVLPLRAIVIARGGCDSRF